MHFQTIRMLRSVFQHTAARVRLLQNTHSKLCCISLLENSGKKPASQKFDNRLFSSQPKMNFLSEKNSLNISFACELTKRQYCNKPEVDVISGMPLKHSEKGDLIYAGPLGKMMKGVKIFSLSTSIIGLCLQPYLLIQAQGHALIAKLAVGITISFFVFITPLMIHWITKKYVTDCYYNKNTNEFTAATISLFLRRKEVKFMPDDVVIPDVPGMFTSMVVKGKSIFMDPKMFYSRDAYVKMMSYDKPLDWEIPNTMDEDDISQKSKS